MEVLGLDLFSLIVGFVVGAVFVSAIGHLRNRR